MAWSTRHSVELDVSRAAAWRYWSDVESWARLEGDAVESITLHGPFQTGTRGTTRMRGQEPRSWALAEVDPPGRAVIETGLPGAELRFTWTFEALAAGRTRVTQQIDLEGPRCDECTEAMETHFAPNLGPGMEKLARAMTAAVGGM